MKSDVLHIISTPGLGGAQVIVKSIVTNSSNQYIYCFRKDKINMFKGLNNIYYYNSYKYYKFNPLILVDLYRIIKKYDFKILHLHLGKPLIYAYIIKTLSPKIKIVYHEHGKIFSKKDKRVYSIYLNLLKNKVNIFIAISKATKLKLIKNARIDENKIKILYNFVDLNKFNPKSFKKYNITKQKEKLGIEKNDFIVGFAGRLVKRKGWEEFIRSAKIISEENVKIKFLIAGDGPDKQKMNDLITQLGLNKKVFYLGFMSDVGIFYRMIDCFIMPSHWEPMGISELEAQAMRIPVIVSNVVALNEIIINNKNGLLFKSKDQKDLAEKIRLVYIDEKLRKKLIENGLESVEKYSLDIYLKELYKIYI